MIDALLALVYVPFGYAIAMLRYAAHEDAAI